MTPTRRVRPDGTSVPRVVFLLAILALVAACATPAGGPGGSGLVLTGASHEPEAQDKLAEARIRPRDALPHASAPQIDM